MDFETYLRRRLSLIQRAQAQIRPYADGAQERAEEAALARGALPSNARSIGLAAWRDESDKRYTEIKATWPPELQADDFNPKD